MSGPSPSGDETWRVYSLCAAWCGICGEWRSAFEELSHAHPAVHFAWVDIEDEADTLGEVDVETFPTLLVARGRQPQFFGPVLPSAAQCQRLLGSLQANPARASLPPAVEGLLQRLLNRA